MNISRNANKLKKTGRSGSQIRKVLLLGVVNLLVGMNVWAQQVVVPTSLSASSVSSNSVTLRWTDTSSNERNEIVSRSLQVSSGFSDIATLTANSTQYTDNTVQPSTTYYYTVSAVAKNGTRFTSAPLTVTTSANGAPPTATTTSASNISPNAATSNGNANPNGLATTAYFQYGTTTAYGGTSASQSAGSGTTPVNVSANLGALTPSTTYHYRAAANNVKGTSYGADMTFTTGASGALPTVSTLAATGITTNRATANGTANPNGLATTAYFQFGTTTAYGSTTGPQAIGSGTTAVSVSASLVLLTPSTTYHYRLVASNNLGTSYGADTTFATTGVATDTTAPTVPTSLTASAVSSSQINLVWNGSTDTGGSGLAGYKIYRNGALIGTTASTSYSATGLSAGTTYLFSVAAYDNAGNTSAQGAAVSATTQSTTDTTPPTVPTSLTASAVSSSQINLVWNGSTDTGGSGLAGYKVYKNGVLVMTSAGTSYSVTGLSPSTTYSFTVAAYDNAGNTSAQSATVSATTQAGATLTITTVSPLPAATVGAAYSGTFSATGGTTPYTWSISAGSLPAGLTLSSGGVLSGTPTTATTASFTVQCTGGSATTKAFSLTVNNSVTSTPWAKSFGSTGADVGYSVASDASGNLFVAGYFSGSVNFGGGTLTSAGGQDIFVAKYSPSGAYLWATRIGGSGDDEALSIAVDPRSGDVAITGYFQNSVTFGANTYTSAGGKDVFLAKLSGANGAVQWSRQISGHSTIFADDTGNGVAIDPNNGDVVVVGTVAAYTDFGGGLVFTTASSIDSFVARYSSSGTYLWAKHSNCISGDYAESVAVDTAGNVLVAGWNAGGIDWGGGLLSFLGSGANSYVVKLTSSGTYVWGQSFGALTGDTTIYSLAVNSSGDVAISGTFLGTMNFGSGIAPIASAANNAAFTVKLSGASGSALWAKAFVPSGNSMAGVYSAGNAVAFDASGNVVVTGDFLPACDFGGGLFTSAGSMDGFVAKYNGSGTHLWSQKFGGTGWDGGFGVTVDKTGNPIVTGATSGGTFNGTTLPSAGGNDIFLMKLAP